MRRTGTTMFLAACVACSPGLPLPDKDDTSDVDTDDTDTVETDETDESDLPPLEPCSVREVEPNNGPDKATVLPTEIHACGGFDAALDVDFWRFELLEDTWIQVDVEAYAIGSRANVQATLSAPGTALVVASTSFLDRPDVRILLPSRPATFELVVSQESAGRGEGDDFFYEVFASTSKPPLPYEATEQEPNDGAEEAQAFPVGQSVLGFVDDAADEDVYELEIPAGTQTLTLDVVAQALGSAGDFALELQDADGGVLGQASNGLVGFDKDPALIWTSTVRQTVRVVVRSERPITDVGPPFWYVLRTALETEP